MEAIKECSKKQLPEMKPSELIKLALRDLEAAEKSERYVVSMDEWHEPITDYNDAKPTKKCVVCLAGSVMAGTLGESLNASTWPDDFDERTYSYLVALNEFRKSGMCYGVRWMRNGCSSAAGTLDDVEAIRDKFVMVPTYRGDPVRFKEALLRNAAVLAEAGL